VAAASGRIGASTVTIYRGASMNPLPSFIARLAAAAALAASFTLPALAQAPNRLDEIVARGALRVGSTGDYKPFSYRPGKTTEFIGSDIELASELAKSLGVKLQIVPTSWPTLAKDFGEDKFDLAIGGVSVTMDRQKKGVFSIPYQRDGKTPITRCENQAKFQTLQQIDQPGVRLIVNPGGTNERFAKANLPHAQLTVYPDNVTIFEQIVERKADLMITDAIETRLQQRLHPQLCAVHPDQPFDFSEKAIWLPRDWVFKAYVDQWLHQQIETGALSKTTERWLDFPWGLEPLRQAIDRRLLLAEDVARFKWNTKAPIEDRAREAQIIAGLAKQAESVGVPAAQAEAFFRAQIEASKTVQRELFARWEAEHHGPFADAPDLAGVTRPKLDALTAQLLRGLADNQKLLHDPTHRAEAARLLSQMDAAALSPAAAQEAVAPLLK
jgi:chorismate mutase-like protein